MIQMPNQVVGELLQALDEAIEVLGRACQDCDVDKSCSAARSRLYSVKKVLEETAVDVQTGVES